VTFDYENKICILKLSKWNPVKAGTGWQIFRISLVKNPRGEELCPEENSSVYIIHVCDKNKKNIILYVTKTKKHNSAKS
jgi:hypothetical protein